MLRPQGYLIITSQAHTIERDTITCGHCNAIVFVKPGSAQTVYLVPQGVNLPDKEEMGAACRCCMRAICLHCYEDGRCTPLEKRIEAQESRRRLLDRIGIA